MDLHSAVSVCEHRLDIFDVVCKLDGITEGEHPWLSVISDGGVDGVITRVEVVHDLFSDRDSDL